MITDTRFPSEPERYAECAIYRVLGHYHFIWALCLLTAIGCYAYLPVGLMGQGNTYSAVTVN